MRIFWSKTKGLIQFLPEEAKKKFKVVRRWPPWLKKTILILLILSLLGSGTGYWYMFRFNGCFFNVGCLTDDKGNPLDLEKLARSDFKKASYVYAKNGEIIGMYFDEIRDPVRINEIPKLLKDAFVAAEDQRFYKHSGIDIPAIISASIGNGTRKLGWRIWSRYGGASTITQQFARLDYANEVSDFALRAPTLWRKIKEARLAIRLEKRYSKEQILEGYLNIIWLGHGANGISAAAQRYSGKNIRKDPLTIREAVILAAVNKYPAVYDPIFHKPAEPKIDDNTPPEKAKKLREEYESKLTKEVVRLSVAKERYNSVLGRMRSMKVITEDELKENIFQKDENPNTELVRLRPWKNSDYGYSSRIVKEFLFSLGFTEEEISREEGLKVYTTFNSRIQTIASEEFEKHLAFVNTEKSPGDKIDGAFIVIEVKTGNILALSGGHDFNETEYNRVFAARSPGSGFKPLVYAAALEQGKNYFDKVCNCPFTMRGGNGKIWAPRNFQDRNPRRTGYIDLAEGPIWSLNLLTLNLARMIGMPAVMQTTHDLGVWGNPGVVRDSDGKVWFRKPGYTIRGGIEPTLPTAIGAGGVNLIELANAYTVFYRDGKYVHPTLIKEIRSAYGDPVFKAEVSQEKQVLSKETAEKMLGLMRATTKIGTAKISMRNIEQQVACKTGTSNGPKDVSIWCGTPEIFIGIRLGHDDFSKDIHLPEYMRRVSGDSTMLPTGGWIVAPIARKFFDRYYANRQKVAFSENVEGHLAELLQRYPN